MEKEHYKAIYDVHENLENRNHAIDEYGYGIFEFCFGERNILEDIIKNDNIMEVNDIINDFDIEDYDDEYYGEFKLNDNVGYDGIFCISYFEDGYSIFVNIGE